MRERIWIIKQLSATLSWFDYTIQKFAQANSPYELIEQWFTAFRPCLCNRYQHHRSGRFFVRKSSPTSRGSSCKRKYGATTPPRGAKLGKRGFRLLYIFTSPGSLQPVTKKATTSDWASSSRPITSPPRNYEDYISSTSARATRSTTSILKTLKIDERCATNPESRALAPEGPLPCRRA